MKENVVFRQVAEGEIQAVFALITGRMAWMDEVGIRLWNVTDYHKRYPIEYYEMRRQKGELFVLADRDTGALLCVGALMGDDERWQEKAPAYYLHHFASCRYRQGAGSLFLQMAEEYTRKQGMTYLRLDSAIGNEKLENYYASRGYVPVGYCKDGVYEGTLRQKKL